jgi:dihydrofolate reductase / thymidylate synthase
VESAVVPPPSFTCVLAADEQRGIGRGNDLPWPKLPGDLAHFKAVTTRTREPGRRNAVILGRRTWDSVPPRFRPLSGRLNVVVSRHRPELPEGVLLAGSLDEAAQVATDAGAETIHLVGGGTLYREAVRHPGCQVIYYTRIAARFECDTFIPAFEDDFVLEAADPPRTEADITYVIERWRRRP